MIGMTELYSSVSDTSYWWFNRHRISNITSESSDIRYTLMLTSVMRRARGIEVFFNI